MNPHNMLVRVGETPVDRWRCHYCEATGTYEELRAVACTHVYPPCSYCGQTPECASDCPGIAMALATPGVLVVDLRPGIKGLN